MRLCEKCLLAIESREGRMSVIPIAVDVTNEEESRCDWCKECGFPVLHEVVKDWEDRNE